MRTILLILIPLIVISCASKVPIQNAQIQKKEITGQVRTETGNPVKGALLFVDSTPTVSKTNRKGNYDIKIKHDTDIIAVYSESHGSEEALYLGQDTINFVLSGSYNATVTIPQEEEEYIDIGYGRVKRDNLTTSVGSVSKEKINQPHYNNIYSMIQGEVPGVTVSGERILIRGIHSINASSEPLFVVDGVRVTSISYINPRDVESINILKGAAASIYGVNGANGVILINMKKADRK